MNIRSSLNALAFLLTALGTSAQAAVVLPSGDTFLNGTFEFTWGSNGAARIDPALYVGGNAAFPTGLDQTFVPPDGVIASTGLGFDYLISGFGTGAAHITYRIANHTDTSWHNLRFIGDVSGGTFDVQKELVTAIGAGGGAGEATRFGIDDFFTGDLFLNDVLNNGQLDNTDHCQGACEAEGALQWQLDVLGQGETWQIDVLLSDMGATQAQRRLEFALTDGAGVMLDPEQALTYSGIASVSSVPLPPSLLLFGAGCAALARMSHSGASRKRRAARTA